MNCLAALALDDLSEVFLSLLGGLVFLCWFLCLG